MQNEEISAAPETMEETAPKAKVKLGIFKRLKGTNRYETMENYSLFGVVFGALIFAGGIGLTAINTQGIPVVITMLGAFVSFVSSVILVFSWLLKAIFVKQD
jgi:hypothetical protein